jgi:hypothetical protein
MRRNNNLKRILAITISLLLITGMTACKQNTTKPETDIVADTTNSESEISEVTNTPEATNVPQATEKPEVTDTPEESKEEESKLVTKPTAKPTTKPTAKPTTKPTAKPDTTKPTVTEPETKPEVTKAPKPITPPDKNESQEPSYDEKSLDDIMNAILKDIDIPYKSMNTEITSERFSWYFGIDAMEGAQGLASEAMIGSVAHSICILQLPEGADVNKIASTIEENADPRKWICVEADKTIIKHNDNIILLAMTDVEIADAVAANFDSLYN